MDYTLNAPLFICFLRSYLAQRAPGQLGQLLRGNACPEEVRTTRLLLNGLQVLLALDKRRLDALAATPPAPVAALVAQQGIVVSYCLTLMDLKLAADISYGLTLEAFDHCGEPPLRTLRRVRSANNRLLAANEKYISAGAEQAYL